MESCLTYNLRPNFFGVPLTPAYKPLRCMSRALFSIGFVQVLIILVNMVRAKVLSILLGPAGFGVVSTIDQIVVSVIQLGGLAVPAVALKLLSYAHSDSHEKFQEAYSSFLSGILGLSLIATAIMLALIGLKPDLFGADIVPYIEYLNLALLSVPTLMLALFFVNTLAAAQKSEHSIYLHFIVTLSLTVAGCLGVYFGGIMGLYIATIPTGIIASIGTLVFVRRTLKVKVFSQATGLVKAIRRKPEIASIALVLYITLSAYSIMMLVVRFFVFSSLGEEQVGFLQALLSIALALGAISGPMNALFFMPLVNRALPLDAKLKAAHDFQRTITLLMAAITLPFILFPKLALFLLFSSEFIVISQLVYLFILWQCLFQMLNVYQQLLVGLDDTLFATIGSTSGYLIAIILCALLIPDFGLTGTAIALIIGLLVTGLMTSYRLKTKFHSAIPADLWVRTLLCLAGITITGLTFNQIEEWSLGGITARAGFACAYISALWFFLNAEQKQFVLNLRHKLPF